MGIVCFADFIYLTNANCTQKILCLKTCKLYFAKTHENSQEHMMVMWNFMWSNCKGIKQRKTNNQEKQIG